MLKEILVSKPSWINKIHPSIRLIFAIFYSCSVALFYKFESLIAALLISSLMILIAKLNFKFVVRRLLILLGFLLIIWIILPLSYEIKITANNTQSVQNGSLLALQITIKSLSISLCFMALIATMTLDTLGYSLNCIYMPKKMTTLILFTYRYLFLIEQEYYKLLWAITLRGFSPKTNLHTYKTYSYLFVIMFIRAHDRAFRVYNAMICRNFNGNFFTIKKYTFNYQSFIFSFFAGVLLLILFVLEIKT